MLLAIALMAQNVIGEFSYSEVRSLAGEHKRLLSAEEETQIQRAFTEAMISTLPQRVATVRPTSSVDVSVVLSLDSEAKVIGTWAKDDDALTECMERQLATRTYVPPPAQPFYILFDVNFGLKQRAP